MNINTKKYSIADIKKISQKIVEGRKKQFLSKFNPEMLSQEEANEIKYEKINFKENFIFEIQKQFGLNVKSKAIANAFPFGTFLVTIDKNLFLRNSDVEKSTFIYHFVEELSSKTKLSLNEKLKVYVATIRALGLELGRFTFDFINENATKEIPAMFYDEEPKVPEIKFGEPKGEPKAEPKAEPKGEPKGETKAEPKGEPVTPRPPQTHPPPKSGSTTKKSWLPYVKAELRQAQLPEDEINLITSKLYRADLVELGNYLSSQQRTDKQIDQKINELLQKSQDRKDKNPMMGKGMIKIGSQLLNVRSLSKIPEKAITEKLAVLLGSRQAGNDSKEVNNMIKNILHVMVKRKFISKTLQSKLV